MAGYDLERFGDVLNKGQSGLIVVYATNNMADQIAADIKATDKYVSRETHLRPRRPRRDTAARR